MHLCCPIHCIVMQILSDVDSFEIAFFETVALQKVQMQHAVFFNRPLIRHLVLGGTYISCCRIICMRICFLLVFVLVFVLQCREMQ